MMTARTAPGWAHSWRLNGEAGPGAGEPETLAEPAAFCTTVPHPAAPRASKIRTPARGPASRADRDPADPGTAGRGSADRDPADPGAADHGAAERDPADRDPADRGSADHGALAMTYSLPLAARFRRGRPFWLSGGFWCPPGLRRRPGAAGFRHSRKWPRPGPGWEPAGPGPAPPDQAMRRLPATCPPAGANAGGHSGWSLPGLVSTGAGQAAR